ncbi:MAG TPA: TlpA disulfide reductase family protein [Vicinamibacterales bacterium]|nr:TlpA disulfide reductase family protein [Vicinamibacterales bacterium]
MNTKRAVLAGVAALALLLVSAPARAQSLAGLWDATVVVSAGQDKGTIEVPFRFEIAGSGSSVKGSFFNGDEKVTSTSGQLANGTLTLAFDEYGTKVEAQVKNGQLEGQYERGTRGAPYPFKARRFTPAAAGDAKIPSIAGLWNVQVGKSSKGEAAWQLIVRQSGPEVSAAILRIDGDTGALTGTYRDGTFVLSHFSGARPLRLELRPSADGSLAVVQNKDNPLTAIRAEQAKAKGLPEPSDPTRFTSVSDPTEPFRFSFPDLNGKVVSNTDPRFAGKVVIVAIGGSWCPNCHDETPFLVELYKKYKARGLEIVELSFEEEAQLKDPVRVRAFIKKYGVEYTVLLPGEPKELNAKVPQGVNLNSFPTTFFLGRDGRVRSAHAGFPGKASGKFHEETTHEVTALVERLLAEKPTQTSASR